MNCCTCIKQKQQNVTGVPKKFVRDTEQNLLIIRAFCEREFTPGGEKKKKWQNAYFHLKMPCVKRTFQDFKFPNLKLVKEVKSIMSDNLKEKLQSLEITVPANE